MKDILEFIFDEFIKAKYVVVKRDIKEFTCILKHNYHEDYWIVMNDFNLEQQKEYFKTCQSIVGQDPASLKNISVLIVKEVENIGINERQWCIDLENNPFFFKKYGLVYTMDAWSKLKELFKSMPDDSFTSIIMKPELFSQYKDGDNVDIALMYSIAHKMPFIMIETQGMTLDIPTEYGMNEPQKKELIWLDSIAVDNLEEMITTSLKRIKDGHIKN